MNTRSRSGPVVALAIAFSSISCASARDKTTNVADDPGPPENTVFVTRDQLHHMKIVTEAVDVQDVDDTVLVSGKVAYDDQKVAHVFSPVSGKVVKVFVQLGARVKKGDPLATIESPDIGAATADVSKAKADLLVAERELSRQKELLDLQATSQKEFDTVASNERLAKAELERAQQKAGLFQRGDAVGQSFTLRSDMDGEVFMKAVSPGMQIAGQYGGNSVELFTVGETDRVWVLSDVFELDLARIKLGAKVVVNVPSLPDRDFDGKVDWISDALDPTTHATKVRCTFDNADHALKPEMFATVKISTDAKKALAVPRSSVLRLGDQTVVFVDRGSDERGRERFERVPVSVDEGEGSKWLVVDHGLVKGDQIVTDGAILLSAML
jgi:cobalt-zinc-cadmium efflux system membrane fusion protein